ncbi:hypothetical protein [Xylella fastidiosa]|uniref:hypothetical protein n=1 Tax=Xylella fastidiosa TaxID=2371 RepID=UPI000AD9BE9A|nr:hypothetical protein [Xylella fastidiosa]
MKNIASASLQHRQEKYYATLKHQVETLQSSGHIPACNAVECLFKRIEYFHQVAAHHNTCSSNLMSTSFAIGYFK